MAASRHPYTPRMSAVAGGRRRPRSSARLAALGLASVLALSACSGQGGDGEVVEVGAQAERTPSEGSTSAGPQSVTPAADPAALVVAMSDALAAGDADAWAAHFTPDAQAAQRSWFAGVQAVPMSVREIRLGDVSSDGARVDVGLHHQIEGVDPEPVVEEMTWTLATQPDGSVLVSKVGSSGDVTTGYPRMWDRGETHVVVDDQLVLVGPADRADDIERLRPSLDIAAASVLRDTRPAGVSRLYVELATEDDFKALSGRPEGYAWFVLQSPSSDGATVAGRATTLEPGPGKDNRLLLDLDQSKQYLDMAGPNAGGHGLLRSAGLYVGLGIDFDVDLPFWASEGLARWYETAGDPAADTVVREYYAYDLAGTDPPDRLPVAHTSMLGDDEEATLRLGALSFTTYAFLADSSDVDTVLTFARELFADPSKEALDALLQKYFGMDLKTFEQKWIAYVGSEYIG